jgi:hypothetical protein
VRFEVADELRLFAESIGAAVGEWEAPRLPEPGAWHDDRDPGLAARLEAAGWFELWTDDDLLAPAIAGAFELGRALVPICAVDEAALGAPLWVDGRARHGLAAERIAVPRPGGGLAIASRRSEPVREATLDGSGTVRVDVRIDDELRVGAAAARWRAWSGATLAYLAGLGGRVLELAVEHARSRDQFGAPLASLPAVQARLADAALAVEGTALLAWARDDTVRGPRSAELLWAGAACCDVTASALQIHGALAFALDSGLHRFHRRARSVRSWTDAACAAAR